MFDGVVPPGERLATQRLDASSRLRIVDAILSGTHERGTSHYELLRAFVDDETIGRIDQELNARDYRTHEFGDSVFLERAANKTRPCPSRLSPHHSMCQLRHYVNFRKRACLCGLLPNDGHPGSNRRAACEVSFQEVRRPLHSSGVLCPILSHAFRKGSFAKRA
jgi:hypothetical protein